MKGNFVAKHMRTFNHGGAHKNKKDLVDDFDIDEQLDLSEYQELTKYKNEITEIGGIEIPPIHFLLLTFFNICV